MSNRPPDLEPKHKQGLKWLLFLPLGIAAVFVAGFGVICLNASLQEKRQQDRAGEHFEQEDQLDDIQKREQELTRPEYLKRQQAVMDENQRQRDRDMAEEEIWRREREEKKRQEEFHRSLDEGKILPGHH
jgi:hypothetical protein